MTKWNFGNVYHYMDVYVAKEFEGLPFLKDTFDNDSYLEMRNTQKIQLVHPMT